MEFKNGSETLKITSAEVFNDATKMVENLEQSLKTVQAMIDFAKEKGIDTDLSGIETAEKFAPFGEYERTLIQLNGSLSDITIELLNRGVKMTAEDVDKQLEKMKQTK
jgi:hypothetical protein